MDQLLVVQVYQAVGVSSEIGKDTGFSRAIGISSSFAAVLWGLWDGLNLCLQLHLQHVEVELDAKAVLVLLSSNSVSNSEISALVFYCRELLKRILIPEWCIASGSDLDLLLNQDVLGVDI